MSFQTETVTFRALKTSVPSTREKIIISGISGFTGINLCKALNNLDFDIYAIKRKSNRIVKDIVTNLHEISLEDQSQAPEVFDTDDVSAVIHLATNYKREEHADSREEIWNANYELGKKLLAISIRTQAHFVHIESYLQFEEIESSEYIKSKIAFSALVDQERKRNSVGISSLVFFDNYGESDNRNKILDLLIRAKKNGIEMKLENPQGVVLFTSINDVSNSIIKAIIEKQYGRFRVNGSDKFILHELAEFIYGFPSKKVPKPVKNLTYTAEQFPLLNTFCQTRSVIDYIKSELTKDSIDAF